MGKIVAFQDLIAWQKGHDLVLRIYELSKLFPKDEQFLLTNQIRRAVVSITSNIAEGFSRRTLKDKTSFYYISLGSLTEVQNQLLIAKDLDYISEELYDTVLQSTVEEHKTINALIRSLKEL